MQNEEKVIPIFEKEFYHDGRGPTLDKVVWERNGIILKGFEFYNPDDNNKKHIILEQVESFAFASEEVHGNILCSRKSNAALFRVDNSIWKSQFNQRHIAQCNHYQIVFYDEIFDVICRNIIIGNGDLKRFAL